MLPACNHTVNKDALTCHGTVRYYGGTYIASVGRGRLRLTASNTSSARNACQRVAAKVFKLDSSNTQSDADIQVNVTESSGHLEPAAFTATLQLA